jgi:hypothetical protein
MYSHRAIGVALDGNQRGNLAVRQLANAGQALAHVGMNVAGENAVGIQLLDDQGSATVRTA